jgi:hypothetical protein
MSSPSHHPAILGFVISAFLLAACGGEPGAASAAIEDYLDALVDKDAARLTALSCADWEAEAIRELDSFAAVTPQLEDVSCQTADTEGNVALVECTGSIRVTYSDEDKVIELESRRYRAVFEGGEWRMCGYE